MVESGHVIQAALCRACQFAATFSPTSVATTLGLQVDFYLLVNTIRTAWDYRGFASIGLAIVPLGSKQLPLPSTSPIVPHSHTSPA